MKSNDATDGGPTLRRRDSITRLLSPGLARLRGSNDMRPIESSWPQSFCPLFSARVFSCTVRTLFETFENILDDSCLNGRPSHYAGDVLFDPGVISVSFTRGTQIRAFPSDFHTIVTLRLITLDVSL